MRLVVNLKQRRKRKEKMERKVKKKERKSSIMTRRQMTPKAKMVGTGRMMIIMVKMITTIRKRQARPKMTALKQTRVKW